MFLTSPFSVDPFTFHIARFCAKDGSGNESGKDLGQARIGVEGSGYCLGGEGSAGVIVTLAGIKVNTLIGGQEHQFQ